MATSLKSIPASQLVNITPNVIDTGGSPLSLNSIFLTNNDTLPIGQVVPFPTAQSVSDYFGATSQEAALANVYFLGFDNSDIKPGALYFAQYPSAAKAAWIRSGSLSGMTLAQLKAIPSGAMSLLVGGTLATSDTINLSAATSFSNAASIISAAFSGVTLTVIYDSQLSAFTITGPTTGAAASIDYATGDIATTLKFTQETGAVLSQGADVSDPATFMTAVTKVTQNWATFMTLWEPDIDEKTEFAQWTNAQNQRYAYVAWDSDVLATQANNTTCFGVKMIESEYDGVIPVYPAADKAAFVCGTAAAIDFTALNGRITFAWKGQSGLTPDVTDATIAQNLEANGYNFYAAYATANDRFINLQPGQVPGKWRWIDEYINQIYLNSQLQLALMTLLSAIKSVPFNAEGDALLSAAAQDPINEAINNGTIRTGVNLSEQQKAQVNRDAGLDISQTLMSQGYYFQTVETTAQQRGLRHKACKFWYTSGGSVHTIDVTSIDIL
ncbi:MAG: DUF3383 domain-containing protein [Burkholderiaceae bacterium]|jgi:hypothetical protein|nr:DUF3383 domain-containing protein [Burkholderiaceae bacterium]